MRVSTNCGGELAAPFGPLCDRDICGNDCGITLADLDSTRPTDSITVTERDDLTFEAGMRLRPQFDHRTERWDLHTPLRCRDACGGRGEPSPPALTAIEARIAVIPDGRPQ